MGRKSQLKLIEIVMELDVVVLVFCPPPKGRRAEKDPWCGCVPAFVWSCVVVPCADGVGTGEFDRREF